MPSGRLSSVWFQLSRRHVYSHNEPRLGLSRRGAHGRVRRVSSRGDGVAYGDGPHTIRLYLRGYSVHGMGRPLCVCCAVLHSAISTHRRLIMSNPSVDARIRLLCRYSIYACLSLWGVTYAHTSSGDFGDCLLATPKSSSLAMQQPQQHAGTHMPRKDARVESKRRAVKRCGCTVKKFISEQGSVKEETTV